MNLKNIKIRCSELHSIVPTAEITEKQLARLSELTNKEKPTAKQAEELKELQEKQKAGGNKLTAGAISYYKLRLLELETGRREVVNTKGMQKGIEKEGEAISMVGQLYNLKLAKNETEYSNDYITGIPDIIYEENGATIIRDIKVSENIFSFPMYESRIPTWNYFHQLQGYMWLTGADIAYLDYVLVNTPEWQLNKSIKFKYFELLDKYGDETSEEFEKEMEAYEQEVRFNNTYDDIALNKRVKTFVVEKSTKTQSSYKAGIELLRSYTL